MRGLVPVRLLSRHAKWAVLVATVAGFALSAAPASAIMVKLSNGHYANYDAISGAKAPKAAKIFDAAFTNLDYSGGPVMPSSTNYIVEWLPSNYGGHTAFQGTLGYPLTYLGGVQKFFQDMAADSGRSSNSDAVATQYNDTTGAHSAYSFSYGGLLVDTDPLPSNGCPALSGDICITDAQIQSELNSFLGAHGVAADLSHEYYLVTPPDVASCFDTAGNSCSANADLNQQFCAYHSRSTAGYVYSNIPDLSGINGCDPFVTFCPNFNCNYNNGPGDGVLSAISHEHNESITDPEPNNAWTDWGSSVGGENGDKCNNDGLSDPNVVLQDDGSGNDTPYNEVIGGSHYLIQREWSNQTKQCLGAFVANGSTATGSFTDATVSGTTESFSATAASSPGGVAEYVWQFNTGVGGGQVGTFETSSPTITHTFPTTGVYTVALTVMNGDGTSFGTAHAVYVGGTAPTAAISAGSGLEGSPLPLSATGVSAPTPGATIVSYAWFFGDGTTGSGASVSHTYAVANTYTATLVVTDSYGQVSAPATRAVVVADESPVVAFTAPSGTAGRAVHFAAFGSDPDGSITSVAWSFGDGHTGSGASTSHTYFSAGTYTVTATVTDSSGRTASVSHPVRIAAGPCVVPGLKGDTLSKARTALSRAHCALGKVTSPKKPKRSAGRHHKWVLVVASQKPGARSVKPRGTKVALKMTWKSVHS